MHGLCRDAPVTAPIIPDDYDLGFFNYITGYTMHALSRSQSMGMLQVIPGEGKTVKTIMAFRFPSNHANTPCLSPDSCVRPGPRNSFLYLHGAFQGAGSESIVFGKKLG